MGNTLQEQLLKAGLVDKSQLTKARKQKSKKARKQRSSKVSVTSEEATLRRQEQAMRAVRDRELNRRREEQRRQREIAAQVKQLVETHRHPRSAESEDDIPFHFESKGKVKKLYVSADTHKLISVGKLVIINCNGIWELVPSDIAERIRERNPGLVIDLPEEQKPAEDDPYAKYKVPDDLMW